MVKHGSATCSCAGGVSWPSGVDLDVNSTEGGSQERVRRTVCGGPQEEMPMSLSIRPLSPVLGVEALGVDLSHAPDNVTAAALRSAFEQYKYGAIHFGRPWSQWAEQVRLKMKRGN